MTDLYFDDNLQPVFDPSLDLKTIDGIDEFHQSIRLRAISKMYPLLSEFNDEDVEDRLRLEITRIAREYDLLGEINYIEIEQTETTGYTVRISYFRAEDFETELTHL
jgi:hypothetical protein